MPSGPRAKVPVAIARSVVTARTAVDAGSTATVASVVSVASTASAVIAPSVVIARLHFVPGVAPVAVVPVAHRPHEPQALLDETLVDEVAGDLVLDAGPHLVAVDERDARTAAARP